ncbi:MAG: deoxyribodipyrimidine photo-lyase [Gemmatimonadaceae bacterium]
MSLQLVWFKRDLRLHDHAPLVAAARFGPVVGVYLFEPAIFGAPDADAQHLAFVIERITELRARLRRRGSELLLRTGDAVEQLDQLVRTLPVQALWAHEETGNAISYARDRRVRAWAKTRGLPFRELPSGGVVRRLTTRDGWAEQWDAVVRAPVARPSVRFAPLPWDAGAPELQAPLPGSPPEPAALGAISHATRLHTVRGGEQAAHATLASFLSNRGLDYRRAMSSPVTAFDACSRISPHLAFGTLSGRQAWQAARRRAEQLQADADQASTDVDPRWKGALRAFIARLAWRDHFIQKLESEPRIEMEPFSAVYRDLRPREADPERLAAWLEGRTGYPFVDACMRALRAEGWLNFRMRAMLVSFASYHLWLPWQATAVALAPHFLDYEPGIHYSQFQMQSGTTGINTVRIYNPYKQGLDQDPDGDFIRRWVPELTGVPTHDLHAPHAMPALVAQMSGVRIGRDYPFPIVDHVTAYREAKVRLFAARATAAARAEAAAVLERHGSRRARRA